MIFAAGFGTRMGDLTKDLPKPMLPVSGRPMIDHAIDLLVEAGAEPIVANTHYLADRLEPHLRQRGVIVCHEDPILETGGGLRASLPELGKNPVITMNPDAVWTGPNPVRALIEAWRPEMQALLMLVPMERAHATGKGGDFSLEHGEIRRKGPYRYTGLQMLRTDRLDEIADDAFSLNRYWDLLMADGVVHGVVHTGAWCDIGHPDGLFAAERLLRA